MKGWTRYWRARRRQLRDRMFGLAESSHIASRECACRDAMAQRIGKPAAKAIELMLALDGHYGDPIFVIMTPMSHEQWQTLKDIRGLAYPYEFQLNL